ncbi:MAG: hypothetical protein HY738_08615, partial [Bacteroidia bacterium]|nr:hypothetical protein [Bacteroidia bacterium]
VYLNADTNQNYSYQWYLNNSVISGADSCSYAPVVSGIYTVEVTDNLNYGSIFSNGIYVEVDQLADSIVTASGPTEFCISSVDLQAATGTGYTYQWYQDGSPVSGGNASSLHVTTSGDYFAEIYNSSGCLRNSEHTMVNATLLIPVITAGGNTTFCQGDNVVLSSDHTTWNEWYKDGTTTGITTQDYTATTAGVYKCYVNTGSCFGFSQEIAVSINNLPSTPSITPGGSTTFCQGGSVTLTTSAGNSYIWSTGATTQSISATTGGNYTVQVTDANGCISAASSPMTVILNNLPATPTITPSGSTSICLGNSVTLTAPASSAYLWSTSETTQSISVNTAGSFSVQVTDGNGCTSASSSLASVTVNNLPSAPTITPNGSVAICQGSSVALSVPVNSGYLWSTGATTQSINATAAGSYTVQITDANGCTSASSSPVTVTVNSLPATPSITPGGTTTFCQGGSVTLTASVGNGYIWSTGATIQKYFCNHRRKLYGSDYGCKRMYKRCLITNFCDSKSIAHSNQYSKWSDNFLSGKFRYTNSKFSYFLSMEQQCDNAEHYHFKFRKLFCNGY